MDIFRVQLVGQHAGDCTGLGDLLGFQSFAFEHVHEIGVAAEIELVGVVKPHTAVDKQAGQHAVQNGGAHLALDVIADNRQTALAEALAPVFGGWR